MNKRRLRNAGSRPKALLGLGESAAILAGATLQAGAMASSAALGYKGAIESAKIGAKSAIEGAKQNANAIKDQTTRSIEQATKTQELIKEENEKMLESQKENQMIIQMAMGQKNVDDRLEASKLTVKHGGRIGILNRPQYLLRGGYIHHNGNMPFKVPRGGYVKLVKSYSDGDLWSVYGNGHNKGGVDIDFADGHKVEAEGDKVKTGRNKRGMKLGGEYMFVTPTTAYFDSQHDIDGINPAELVDYGMHPIQANNIQETIKAYKGINDDSSKAKYGKRSLKCGGKIRHKAALGWNWNTGTWEDNSTNITVPYRSNNISTTKSIRTDDSFWGKPSLTNTKSPTLSSIYVKNPTNISTNLNSSNTSKNGFGNWFNKNVGYIGLGITAGGNILSNLITKAGNNKASRISANASREANKIMADMYRGLPTLDANLIKREDYRAAHMMPALQAPVSFAASNIAAVDRKLQRRLRNAGRYSASGAATQERMDNAEVEAQDEKNRIYSADQQQMQQIRQANAERVTDAARINAMLDTEMAKSYLNDKVSWADKVYNSKVYKLENAGKYDALGILEPAQYLAQAKAANAQNTAQMISNISLSGANTLSTMAKRKADLENTMLGATTDAQINYIANYGTKKQISDRLAAVKTALASGKLSPEDQAKYRYYETLLTNA